MFWKDWNFWLSIVTASSAVVALLFTSRQIKLSNKQHLFDRRLEAYTRMRGLVSLCEKNHLHLQSNDNKDILFENPVLFEFLVNNSYMHQQSKAIKNIEDEACHVDFLKKCEELESLSEEIQIIFEGKEALQYGRFVSRYKDTLFEMYKYQIVLCSMDEFNREQPGSKEEVSEYFKEPEARKWLFDSFEKLINAYDNLKDIRAEEKIKKQLRLK